MKTICDAGELVRRRSEGFSAAASAFLVQISTISRIPQTLLLRIEQRAPDRIDISERRSDLEVVKVLCHATVASLAEAKDVFHHTEHMLDLGAHPRLGAVLGLLNLVDLTVEAIPPVREVVRVRRMLMNEGALTLVATSQRAFRSKSNAASFSDRTVDAEFRREAPAGGRGHIASFDQLLGT